MKENKMVGGVVRSLTSIATIWQANMDAFVPELNYCEQVGTINFFTFNDIRKMTFLENSIKL